MVLNALPLANNNHFSGGGSKRAGNPTQCFNAPKSKHIFADITEAKNQPLTMKHEKYNLQWGAENKHQ